MKLLFPFLSCCTLTFSLFCTTVSHSQETDYKISTSNTNFVPTIAISKDFRVSESELINDYYYRIIQFYELPTDAEKKLWESEGLLLSDYLPTNCYFATIHKRFRFNSVNNKVRAVIVPDARFKLETPLYQKYIHAEISNGNLQLIVSYNAGIDYSVLERELKGLNAQILAHRDYSRQIDIVISTDHLERLIYYPPIQFIGEQLSEPVDEADNYSHRNTSGRSNYLNTGQSGLMYNGAGVVVCIGEGGTVENHIDFKGRLNEMETGSSSGHKIGSMQNCAGAGNYDPTNKNNAWGSPVISFSGQSYTSLMTNNQARYFNHSYGWGIDGSYSSGARDHDLRTQSYPNHIVSYSSGNSGGDPGFAPYNNLNGWANITGSTKQNKNHLAVRNLDPQDNVMNWGSTGPAFDGRIIPQMIIDGSEGTSYATPKAIGLFAILEEAYKDLHGNQVSNSSLMKGIILNTADDMDKPGPDFRTGYGRPNVRRAYHVIENDQFLTNSVSNGASNNHSITVPANVQQLRVMLIWQDVAAAVNANPAIVNNLGITGTSPDATVYNPWILDHSPDSALLSAPATRGIDNINTIEQITVDNPNNGTWLFTVSGTSVPSGPQTYFVIYEFVYDEVNMAYPIENEHFISADNYQIRWDSPKTSEKFKVEYRLEGGAWNLLAANIDSSARTIEWTAPIVNGIQEVEFKVSRGSTIVQSGINYIGKRAENFRIDKVCNDTVTLKWSVMNGVNAYKIYRLGTQYMEEVTSNITFSGTSAVLTGQSTTQSEYYAISGVTGTKEGQRTFAIEKVPGDQNCGGIDWIGVISTDWFNGGNWGSGIVPTNADNVRIPSTAPFQPLIAATGATCSSILIMNGASLSFSNSSNYNIDVWGDWVNNGTFNAGIGTVSFVDTLMYQEVSGTSANNFYKLKVDKLEIENILEVKSLMTLNAPTNPLELVSGTFELSSNSTITPFTSGSAAELYWRGLWNNGGTINYGNYSWYINGGLLKLTAGTINVGTAANNNLTYMNNGTIHIEGGTLNIAGRIGPNSGGSSGTFRIYDGNMVLNKFGSTSTSSPLFKVNPNANFVMIGGNLIFQNASSNTTVDYINESNNYSVNGGNICIGNSATSASQIIRIQSAIPIYNLVVNNVNSPTARLEGTNLLVLNNVTILGGTLIPNGFNIDVWGDWTNNGAFTPGTSEISFNGFDEQLIGGSNITTFAKLRVDNVNGITLNNSISINNNLYFDAGIISTGINRVNFFANAVATTPSVNSYIDGSCRKAGNVPFAFPIGNNGFYAPLAISAPTVATDHFTASYVHADPNPTYSTANIVAPITNVSEAEYWILSRTNGTSQVDVTLPYNSNQSEEIGCLGNVQMASWDGSNWIATGTSFVTGDNNSGTITSLTQDVFNAFTMANNDAILAPEAPFVQHFCDLTSQVSDLAVTGSSVVWYDNATNGNVVDPSTTLSVNSYFASQTIGACESEERTEVEVTLSNLNASVTNVDNVLTANQTGVSYQWIDCVTGTAILNAIDQEFTPQENGLYAVVIHDGQCGDTSACQTISTIGMEEILNGEIIAYPNPTNSTVTIEAAESLIGNELIVTDALGKIVFTTSIQATNTLLDLSIYADGIYLIQIGNTPSTIHLVKQ